MAAIFIYFIFFFLLGPSSFYVAKEKVRTTVVVNYIYIFVFCRCNTKSKEKTEKNKILYFKEIFLSWEKKNITLKFLFLSLHYQTYIQTFCLYMYILWMSQCFDAILVYIHYIKIYLLCLYIHTHTKLLNCIHKLFSTKNAALTVIKY